MELGLAGRVALVCGSTRGLGRAVAKALSQEGARVAVNGRHDDSVGRAAEELEDETGSTIVPFAADVGVPDQAEQLVQRVAKELGRLDVLFCNASGPPAAPFKDQPREAWHRAVELNLALWVDGPRRGPGAVDPAMRARVGEMQRLAFEIQLAADAQDPPPGPEARPEGSRSDIRAPTLLIVGDEDVTDMLAIVYDLEREIAGARKVVMHGAAHLPSLEQLEKFNRIVREFLSEVL